MSLKSVYGLVKETVQEWYGSNPFLLGAALAYYTVFSLAPVVLLALSIASLVFEEESARAQMLAEINSTLGGRVGSAIASTLQYTQQTGSGPLATVISLVVMLFGASTVFAQLQEALNIIWGVQAKAGSSIWAAVKNRFWSFMVVLGIGFLLLAFLIVNTTLSALAHFLPNLWGATYLWHWVNWLVSFALITLLFALVFKLLPDVEVAWSDVWVGSLITALLFTVGMYLIGLYLGQSTWLSAYGAAGSLVIVLLWVFYSSQIVLFGATFTHVYARHCGKQLVPKSHAEARATRRAHSEGPHGQQPGPEQPGRGLAVSM